MPRRPRPAVVAAVLAAAGVLGGLVACSDDDDAGPASTVAAATNAAPASSERVAPTTMPTTTAPPAPAATSAPSLTTPASVLADTGALGGSSLSTVDLATGSATPLGRVGTEIGVLGIAVTTDGSIDAVTDAPALLVLDPDALDADVTPMAVDAGGETLLALARRPTDGALFAIGDRGGIVLLAADGTTELVAQVALEDPGVGLDIAADGTLEVVVATGAHHAVDPASGAVTDLPTLTGDEAPPRIVAVAHDARGRYGVDAAADELVTIADDGVVSTVGPLGIDVTDGASLDIGPDGVAILANPGGPPGSLLSSGHAVRHADGAPARRAGRRAPRRRGMCRRHRHRHRTAPARC